MKKVIILAFFFAFSLNIQAQLAPLKYLVKFTDKNNSPFSVSNPSQFLSAKAIARRINQGISIKYNDLPVSPAYVDSVINTGVTILNRSKWLNSITIFTDDYLALAKIKSFPFVVSVDSVNKIYSYEHKTTFPEKLESYSSDLSNKTTNSNNDNSKNTNTYDYGFANNQISMISGDYLHNNGYCGQGVTIAVLDAGFSYVETLHIFDSLWANNQILGTKDFVESGGNVFNSHTHGMMVLSTMGGNIPGQLVGTAPKANYWLLRSEDASSEYIIEEYNWASAAEFADSAGADIINSSLGYSVFWDAVMDHTYADMNGHTAPASIAATIAASKGIIVCNSAGNSGGSYRPFIASPADADSIITVGAVDEDENYASFSSTGPTSDGRIKPTVAAQGQGTIVASTIGGVFAGNGTSFSSPVMAGATACLFQAFPSMTNMQIIQAIKESSSQFSKPDNILGYGIPNFAAAFVLLYNKKTQDSYNENNINVFPNPFIDIINVLYFSLEAESIDIDVFDITGKNVYSKSGIQKTSGYKYCPIENVSKLSKGIYILKISSNDKVYTKKLTKISN